MFCYIDTFDTFIATLCVLCVGVWSGLAGSPVLLMPVFGWVLGVSVVVPLAQAPVFSHCGWVAWGSLDGAFVVTDLNLYLFSSDNMLYTNI